MQKTQVQSLLWEKAQGPQSNEACVCEPQLLRPRALEPELPNQTEACAATKTQHSQKKKKKLIKGTEEMEEKS